MTDRTGIAHDGSAAADEDDGNLTVALFHYVPRPRQFKDALLSAWKRLVPAPTVGLRFTNYDCYYHDAAHRPDVFVFDSLYLRHFVHRQDLLPLPEALPTASEDFQDWALQASAVDGTRYGIPCHGCMNIFFYRADDRDLDPDGAGPLTLGALRRIIGEAAPTDEPAPPPGEGLLLDLTGRTTCAGLYLESWLDVHGADDPYPPLPRVPFHTFDPAALANLETLRAMAGDAQAGYLDKKATRRLNWFLQGRGRALIGFTEMLTHVPAPSLLRFRPLPLSEATTPYQFVYVNLASVSSAISRAKQEPALRLLDLMTSTDVMVHSLRPDSSGANPQNPQFIIPARRTVLDKLTAETPGYRAIADLIAGDAGRPCRPFQWGPTSGQATMRAMGGNLRKDLLPGNNLKVGSGLESGSELSDYDREAPEDEKWLPANLFRRN